MEILIEFMSPDRKYSLVVDEEVDVCFAYLKREGKFLAHAWLYNRGETPEEFQWRYREQEPPFKNSRDFVRELDFELPSREEDFGVIWSPDAGRPDLVARLLLRGMTIAEFVYGDKVGRSRLSVVENILASPLCGPENNQRAGDDEEENS